jgi:hypothetical protein
VNDTSNYLESLTSDGQPFCDEGVFESHVPPAARLILGVLVSLRMFKADLASLEP